MIKNPLKWVFRNVMGTSDTLKTEAVEVYILNI